MLSLTTNQIQVFVTCLQNQFKNLKIHMVRSQQCLDQRKIKTASKNFFAIRLIFTHLFLKHEEYEVAFFSNATCLLLSSLTPSCTALVSFSQFPQIPFLHLSFPSPGLLLDLCNSWFLKSVVLSSSPCYLCFLSHGSKMQVGHLQIISQRLEEVESLIGKARTSF